MSSAAAQMIRPNSSSIATTTAKVTASLGLVAVAYIHFKDISEKLDETAYIGVGYIGLVLGCVAAIALLWRKNARLGWMAAGGLCLSTLVGYILSRTTGLPAATYDVGNWSEMSGTVSIIVEFGVALLAGQALRRA